MDSSDNSGPRRPVTRPFVSGRPVARIEPTSSAWEPSRPFSIGSARTSTSAGARTTSTATFEPKTGTPTPLWTVAVYEPGLEQSLPKLDPYEAPRISKPTPAAQAVAASLALAEDVVEAGRYASSAAAADVLEVVARKLRRGEILLLPGASTKGDAAVVSAVLAALLGGRR
jgi:hypothetical protein